MARPSQPTPSAAERDRRKEIEDWWALIARMIAFVGGFVILLSQAFVPELRDPLLIIAGAGMMGPVIATSIGHIIFAARGGRHE